MQTGNGVYRLTKREHDLFNSPGTPWLLHISNSPRLADFLESLLRAYEYPYIYPKAYEDLRIILVRCTSKELSRVVRVALARVGATAGSSRLPV